MTGNEYRENDSGFFVKVTLFKDDVNKAKWRLPFTDETYKQLSRSLGNIPYIDITGKTYDEHRLFAADKLIDQYRELGIDDGELVPKMWDYFNKPENGVKGKLVDIYDVEKKASYGGLLNSCELSAEMVKNDDPQVAVIDFIVKVEDDEYKQKIRDGKVRITPSPSIYGTCKTVDGVDIYDPSQFLDFLHVANATIPANGEHAKMKGFCEGTQSSCKKDMANASVPPVETSINSTVTQDSIRMSLEPQNTPAADVNPVAPVVSEPNSNDVKGFDSNDMLKLFEQYNLPKEVISKFDKLSNELNEMKSTSESTSKKLAELETREQERKANERKSLMLKHIDLNKNFKGDTEAFTNKVNWINQHFASDEDLATYLNEAFPIKAEPKQEKGDFPHKGQAVAGMLFKTEDLLNDGTIAAASNKSDSKAVKVTGWANIIDLPLSTS